MQKHLGIDFPSVDEIDKFLNLKSIGQSDPLHDNLLIKGTDSIIWITWSVSSDDPFDFIKHNNQYEIYNALALSKYYRTDSVFLFYVETDKIKSKTKLIRATVFDAGSYPPFLPPEISFKNHGFTDPYNDASIIIDGTVLTNEKRPEAIISGNGITWADINLYRKF